MLDALVRENPFGVYIVAADFTLRQISRGAEKVFANIDPLLGRDFAEILRILWAEPFATEAIARFRHTLATGEPYFSPATIERRRDVGSVESYDWRILRIGLPDGSKGVVCYFYDLSERQLWEQRMRENDARRSLAMAQARIADWEYEIATGDNTWQQRLREMLIVEAQEDFLQPESWQDLILPEDRARVDVQFKAAIEGRALLDLDFRACRPGGEVRWLSSKGTLIRDAEGRNERLVGVVQDITERVTAAEALSHALTRLGAATAAANLGIHEYLPRTQTLKWDRRMRELWGVAPDVPVSYELFMDRLHPDDRAATQVCVDRALDPDGDGNYRAEYRVQRAQGDQLWVRATGIVTFADRRAERMLGTVMDITDFKVIEGSLRRADQRKDHFLATLSHELRNPLAPIRHASDILCSRNVGREQQEWASDVIRRQVGHMAALLDDLLDVSRISQGKLWLKRQSSVFQNIVTTSVETVRPLIDRKGHQLVLDLPAQVPLLDVDPVRVAQVIGNLLTNAAKYTEVGGVITLSATAEIGQLRIRVTDNGMGIAPDELPNIFELFSQVKPESSHGEGGLGIGLALVRGLVELHGGTVNAHSHGLGRGSSFEITLPFESRIENTAPAHQAHTKQGSLRILVADDNLDAVESLAMLLRLSGHDVCVAHNGEQAAILAQSFLPQVALLDIGMPILDGYGASRAIRSQPNGDAVYIVALTGWGQDGDRRAASSAGFDHHLTKPVDFDELCAVLGAFSARTAEGSG